MKRPVAFYMLLIMASIFLFFFLNLVLGSVSIPLRAVWNILWGTGNESVIWQNIIWKSRVPQALTALVAGRGSLSAVYRCKLFSAILWPVRRYWASVREPVWELLLWCFFRAVWVVLL